MSDPPPADQEPGADLAALRADADALRQALVRAESDLDASRHFSQRITDQVLALLNLSRVARASLQRARVDLSRMAEQIVADLRQAAPERSVTAQVAPGLRVAVGAQLLTCSPTPGSSPGARPRPRSASA